MKTRILALLTVGLLEGLAVASAATLIVSDGELIGATGVNVDGQLYNVEFLDGACTELFTGCDSAADFAFRDEGAAVRASQALLAQVFVDGPAGPFDSLFFLTRGCEYNPRFAPYCQVETPFALGFFDPDSPDVLFFNNAKTYNYSAPYGDWVGFQAFPTDWNSDAPYEVFARWSVVPAPGTLALLGLGLAGLGLSRRRRVA